MFQDSNPCAKLMVGVAVVALWTGSAAAEEQEEAARLYQQGYGLILQSQWQAGADVLRQVLERFPESDWVDDSRYWLCHAEEKAGAGDETSFACFERFAAEFEYSDYSDDAQARMIELGQRLAQQGDAVYADKVRALQAAQREEVALMALGALADIGDEASFETLMTLYNTDLSEDVRARIVHVLEDFDTPEARAQLIEIARSEPSIEVRRRAIRTLGDLDWDETVAGFLRQLALEGEPVEARLQAIRAFGDHGDPQYIPMLVEVASTTADEDIGHRALGAIEDIGGESASEAARSVYNGSELPAVRRRALTLMAEMGGDAMLPELERIALEAADEASRRSALRAIADLESDAALSALSRLATDSPDPRVRVAAIYSLEDFESDQVMDVLVRVLGEDSDPDVRLRAARTLGDFGSDAAVEPLKAAALNDTHAEVRRAAVGALGDIGTASARQALVELLNRP